MAKKLNVDLVFNADISQAKAAMNDLQNNLKNIGLGKDLGIGITDSVKNAIPKVDELRAHLTAAFNTDTGKLNLTEFNKSLANSKVNLSDLTHALVQCGPEGQKAFSQLARAIAQSEQPVVNINKKMRELGTVMSNTIKWQLSSSMIHGFMGAVSGAIGYVKDLNRALTDIQIVTQASDQSMGAFAERANKAAQALSTTTAEYAKAALIFYQQGLSDNEVAERTNTTIKMAQVTGDSAQQVSSYMTAIWNNFDDGSESLEHYADVITALGAATASSSAEIAQGLSKFASIADTVGLSYEYATSALATVVAQTRQSADTVGTAFKTIFARFQDLELGDEGSVDIGTYAQALQKVGINVLDAKGNLLEMNDILDQMGEKWGQLSDAQRVALAQNVAGQRQYAQLMALMENWDSFQNNLSTAEMSEGTLTQQAEIYEKSWAGASKRIKAGLEGIYSELLKDDIIVSVLDNVGKLVSAFGELFKSAGGLKALLVTMLPVMNALFGKQLVTQVSQFATGLANLNPGHADKVKQNTLNKLASGSGMTAEQTAELQKQVDIETKIQSLKGSLNNYEEAYLQAQIDKNTQAKEELAEAEKILQIKKEEAELLEKQNLNKVNTTGKKNRNDKNTYLSNQRIMEENAIYKTSGLGYEKENMRVLAAEAGVAGSFDELIQDKNAAISGIFGAGVIGSAEDLKSVLQEIRSELDSAGEDLTAMDNAIKAIDDGNIEEFAKSMKEVQAQTDAAAESMQKYNKAKKDNRAIAKKNSFEEDFDKEVEGIENTAHGQEEFNRAKNASNDSNDKLNKELDMLANKAVTGEQALMGLSSALFGVISAVNQIQSLGRILNDDDLSAGEKLVAVLTTASMLIPSIMSAYKGIKTIGNFLLNYKAKETGAEVANAGAKMINAAATEELNKKEGKEGITVGANTGTIIANTGALLKNAAAKAVAAATSPVGLAILATTAVVGLTAAIVYLTNKEKERHDALKRQEKAIENAIKAQKAYAEALESAKQKFESINNTLANYNEAIAALDSATKGTKEWDAALKDVNDIIMDIMTNSPELASMMEGSYDENGIFRITNQDEILAQAQNAQTAAQLNVIQGNAAVQQQRAQKQLLENIEGFNDRDVVDNFIDSGIFDFSADFDKDALIQALGEYIADTVAEGDMGYGLANASRILRADGAEEAFRQYQSSSTNIDNMVRAASQNAIDSVLEGYSDEVKGIADDAYNEAYQTRLATVEDLDRDDTADAYIQEVLGGVGSFQGLSDGVYTFIDAQGEEVKVLQSVIDEQIASAQAINDMTDAANRAAEVFNQLNNGDISVESILGEDTPVTQEQFEGYVRAASRGEIELANYAQSLLENGEIDAYNALFANAGTFNTIAERMLSDYDLDLYDNITRGNNLVANRAERVTSSKYYDDSSDQNWAEQASSTAARDTLHENLAEITEQSEGYIYDFVNDLSEEAAIALSNIDVTNYTDRANWKEQFPEYADSIDDFLEDVSYSFQLGAENAMSYSAKVDAAVSKLKTGDTLDSKKYTEMIAALGDGMAQYFQITETGQYRLIANADEFNEAVRQAKIDQFDQAIAEWDAAKIQMRVGEDTNWGDESNRKNLLNELGSDNYRGIEWGDQQELYNEIANGTKTALTKEEAEALVAQMEQNVQNIEAIKAQLYTSFEDAMLDGVGEEAREQLAEYFTQVEAVQEGLDPDVIENYVDELQEMYPALAENEEAARRVALANARFAQGMQTLSSKGKDWFAILNTGDKTLQDYSTSMAELKDTLEDVFDVESELISDEFVEGHLDDLEKAANGDAEAVDRLSVALAQNLAGSVITATDEVTGDLTVLNNYISNFDPGEIEVGATLDDEDFIKALNHLLSSGAIAAKDLEQMMSALGWEVKISGDGTSARVVGSQSTYRGSGSNRGYNYNKSGSGSGSKKETKDLKDLKDESERYHVINNQLEDMAELLKEIDTIKSSAYGKAKIAAMQKEIELAKQDLALGEEKLRQIEQYYKQDQAVMRGYGAEFDENGTITNYDALLKQQVDKYNAAVNAYNASGQSEHDKAVLEAAEKDYEIFTKALKQYEDTADLWFEQYNDNLKKRLEILEKQLAAIEYEVKIRVEIDDTDIKMIEFLLKNLEDDAFDAAKAIELIGRAAKDNIDQYDANKKGFVDVLKNSGIDGEAALQRIFNGESLTDVLGTDWTEQELESLQGYVEGMMKAVEDGEAQIDKAFKKVQAVFDENNKQFETYNERVAHAQKMVKSYQNIVDIVGKKTLGISGSDLRGWNDSAAAMASDRFGVVAAQREAAAAELASTRQAYLEATSEEEKKKWKELLDEQEKEYMKIEENFQTAWEEALSAAKEAFTKNVESLMDDFEDALGFESMAFEKNLEKSTKDLFAPDYERIYQLSNLLDDIGDSISNTKNTSVLNSLVELQQEIVDLQAEGKELSEYDLKYLRLRYEAKLAEAALEDAQNAKSEVRMSRDNEGNYSYIYTANQDEVDKAEDNYRQKIYEMEKANQEYIDQLENNIFKIGEDARKELQEAAKVYGEGTQAYEEAAQRIRERTEEKMKIYKDQMNNVFGNNQRLYDEDIKSYVKYTGDYSAANVNLATDISRTYLKIDGDLNNFFENVFKPVLNNTFTAIVGENKKLIDANDRVMVQAGTSVKNFAKDAGNAIKGYETETSKAKKEAEDFGKKSVDAYNNARTAVQNYVKEALEKLASLRTALSTLTDGWKTFASSIDTATAALSRYNQQSGSTVTGNTVPGGGGGTGFGDGTGKGDPSFIPKTSPTLSNSFATAIVNLLAKTTSQLQKDTHKNAKNQFSSIVGEEILKKFLSSPSDSYNNNNIINKLMQIKESDWKGVNYGSLRSFLNSIKSSAYNGAYSNYSFDTGGYTGAWGREGRLAFLHEKELVLNASDTQNILSAVKGIREISQAIDLNALSSGAMPYGVGRVGTRGQLEQNVTISANFPNVTEKSEIEAAFDNLINKAAQYANRKI